MPNRAYSEAKQAATLAVLQANGGNLAKTARDTGVSQPSICRWRQGKQVNADTLAKAEVAKDELATILERIARKSLVRAESLVDNDATYQQLMTGAAIAIDKTRLLRDQSTVNSDTTIRVVYEDAPAPIDLVIIDADSDS